jgi:glycosyltransferase involved in cell wall biosynthesis
MKILLVTRSWPLSEKSGTTLISREHANFFLENGDKVSLVTADKMILKKPLPNIKKYYVCSEGNGSIYSPAKVDQKLLLSILRLEKPDVVVIEGWQTAISESSIEIAHTLNLPILMISHGIHLHAAACDVKQIARSLLWFVYKKYKLPYLISKLTLLTTLDNKSKSKRFYDRDLALKMNIPVKKLVNFPVNFHSNYISYEDRKFQILLVGYFSPVKNQIEALKLFRQLKSNISLKLVGPKKGKYYEECRNYVKKYSLNSRVEFTEDCKCNIAEEIGKSYIVLLTSITEVLPVTLLESMACGTPFVSRNIGCISSLRSGVVYNKAKECVIEIQRLIDDRNHWIRLSNKGLRNYKISYTRDAVKNKLLNYVKLADHNFLL